MTNRLKAIFLGNDIINDRYCSNLGRFSVQSFKGKKVGYCMFPLF